jgi:hypothetical protein
MKGKIEDFIENYVKFYKADKIHWRKPDSDSTHGANQGK